MRLRRGHNRRKSARRSFGGAIGGRVSDARADRRERSNTQAVAVLRGNSTGTHGSARDPANAKGGSLVRIAMVNQVAVAAIALAVGVSPGVGACGQGRDEDGGPHGGAWLSG